MTIKSNDIQQQNKEVRGKRKRPFFLKVLVLCWVCVAFYGWVRLYTSIEQWRWLQYLDIHPGPLYFAITGTIIGIIGMAITVVLWLRKPWAARYTIAAGVILAVWFWLDQLIFTVSQTAKANWPFLAAVTVFSLLYNVIVINKLKDHFLEANIKEHDNDK